MYPVIHGALSTTLNKQRINPTILVLESNDQESKFVLSALCSEGYTTVFKQHLQDILSELNQNDQYYQAVIVKHSLIQPQDYGLLNDVLALSNKQNKHFILTSCTDADAVTKNELFSGQNCHLIEPLNADLLLSALESNTSDQCENEPTPSSMDPMTWLNFVQFKIKTIPEAQALTQFIAQLFPDPQRVELGLNELMINAIEHGNLGISHPEKSRLLNQGFWPEEISMRMLRPENISKHVEVYIHKCTEEITVKITDQGNGFEWRQFLEMSSDRVSDLHGRGIYIAKMLSFDSLEYLDEGRTAKATVRLKQNSIKP
jgi:anti-sigma regulatory factor (Ser/Thr protein kinase)/ActR/RegA family two-component response regulator